MRVLKDKKFLFQLYNILQYIAQDKKSAAAKFEKGLGEKIKALPNNPLKYKQSLYFEGEVAYRDLTFKGYTVIYS